MLNIIIGLLSLAYPFMVYFSITKLPLSVFVGLLALLFGARLILAHQSKKKSAINTWAVPVSIIMLIFSAIVLLQGSVDLLLYYPVLINMSLLIIFGYSLYQGPPIIERLARLSEPDLPPDGMRYTRRVTGVWCFFFASTPRLPSIQQSLVTYRCGPYTTG